VNGPHVMVVAKAPVAGRVKTRLCPPCTPEEAAAVAEAALADTLEAVARCAAGRRIVALDGNPGPWLPPGFEIISQCGGGLAERLAHAWGTAGGPGLQLGMDTPQVTPSLLDAGLAALDRTGAALGHASDGGWWAIALRRPDPAVFLGVTMGTSSTGRQQQDRLRALGFDVTALPVLIDCDTAADLVAVAQACPSTRTAAVARRLGLIPVMRG
jgi:uncharacterized protein